MLTLLRILGTVISTPEQRWDPNCTPPLHSAIPLGLQHVLAMFVSNVRPATVPNLLLPEEPAE